MIVLTDFFTGDIYEKSNYSDWSRKNGNVGIIRFGFDNGKVFYSMPYARVGIYRNLGELEVALKSIGAKFFYFDNPNHHQIYEVK